jgi:radical SAM protein with 4Fe4S-binding SPASM domain
MSSDGSSAGDMFDRLEAELGKPLRAMLEISDRCNEVCAHCYQVQGQKGELSSGEWKEVLDRLAEQGVLLLTISGGEATLRHDFLELLAHARARGFIIRLFTNGLTMTAELAAELRRTSVFDVEISLYSTRAEVHDFVTGVPGSFERTVAGVRHLRHAGVAVTIKTVIMNVNQHEIDAYIAFANELGARYRFDPGGLLPRENGDRFPEVFTAGDAAVIDVQRRYGASTEPPPEPRAAADIICGAAHSLHIEPNGELRPCTMLDVRFGHVLEDGVLPSFQSERAERMRALRWGDLHGCRDCDLACYCTRCFAASRTESGDALGPYASACAGARRGFRASHPDTDLKIIAGPGRDSSLGPYRAIGEGLFETSDDNVTPRDYELREQLGWTRAKAATNTARELAVRPGELIQIRRPGRKLPRLERVPGGRHAEHAGATSASSSFVHAGTADETDTVPDDNAR